MTGAFPFTPAYLVRVCSDTRDHSLSRLMPGWQRLALLGCTWKFLMPAYLVRVCSDTRDHSLSRLMPGWQRLALLGCTWKFLMPTFPKYPGWYLSKLILW